MQKLSSLLILVLAASTLTWSSTSGLERTEPASAAVPKAQVPAATPEAETDLLPSAAAAPNYNLDWYSINSGGAVNSASTSYQLGASVGQAAAGKAAGAQFSLTIGFWYGMRGGACLVAMTGDVNLSGTLTSADIIELVNFVFKGGAAPLPCEAAGDTNCSGSVTSADIIQMVNHVFKGGSAPCDVCSIIPGTWSCP